MLAPLNLEAFRSFLEIKFANISVNVEFSLFFYPVMFNKDLATSSIRSLTAVIRLTSIDHIPCMMCKCYKVSVIFFKGAVIKYDWEGVEGTFF